MKHTNNDWVLKARAQHHDALKAMMPADSTLSGLQIWRKLRHIENRAERLAVKMCNEPITQEEIDQENMRIESAVEKVFGRKLPGFFINHDPRGYALKLEPNSVPYPLHKDWGSYQILAPEING